jgi:hypothetical protein
MAILNDRYYTKYAKNLINNSLKHENIMGIFEETTIDGCDNLGPKAYIYYLYVIQKNPNFNPNNQEKKYIYELYFAEQYFHKDEVVEYELYTFTQSNTLRSFESWDDFHEIKKEN